MSSAAPGQELLPPPFAAAGGSVCARRGPWPDSTAAGEAEAAPEPWLDSAWAAAAAAAAAAATLLDDGAGLEPPQQGPAEDERGADHFGNLYFVPEDAVGPGDQLSTQIYRNKQLQDTLLQKEEQLAQLQAENRHLKQFLNSAVVRQLEEKAKKLLWQNGRKACGAFKRCLKAEGPPIPREGPHAPKARRSLLGDFSACEEQPPADVDIWVLRTLGLKDIDTIDESAPANYSALTVDPALGSFLQGPPDADISSGQPGVYRCDASAPMDSGTPRARKEPPPFGAQLLSSSPQNDAPLPLCVLPGMSDHISPTTTHMAFSTFLSPHCNVKTHTFRQGQAFVRRDQDGGWKLTWVPKKPE